MAMNNYVLQKIIYAYQNGGADLHYPNFIDGDKLDREIPKEDMVAQLKLLSKAIQQSAKFYVDLSGDTLTQNEMVNCLSGIKFYLPYPSTFIQFKHEDVYVNALFTQTGTFGLVNSKRDEWVNDEDAFLTQVIVSDLSGNYLSYDRCAYHHRSVEFDFSVSAINDRTGKFKMETSIVGVGSNFMKDIHHEDGKGMQLHFIEQCTRDYLDFLVMLNYPEITISDEVLGRPNNLVGHVPVKNMKRTTLMKKPKYQHKTLVLDMYGDKSGGESSSGGRSKGTAFHSVRKHLRQYKNGKKVFVKAHFRGSKEVGMITKDYKIAPE